MFARDITRWIATYANERDCNQISHAVRQKKKELRKAIIAAIEPEPCHFCTFGMGRCTCGYTKEGKLL